MGHHEFGVWRTSAGTTTTSRFTTGFGHHAPHAAAESHVRFL